MKKLNNLKLRLALLFFGFQCCFFFTLNGQNEPSSDVITDGYILFDVSGSMAGTPGKISNKAIQTVGEYLQSSSKKFKMEVIPFGETNTAQRISVPALQELDRLVINPYSKNDSLSDVYSALKFVENEFKGKDSSIRKIVLIVSDGQMEIGDFPSSFGDRENYLKNVQDIVCELYKENVYTFTILIRPLPESKLYYKINSGCSPRLKTLDNNHLIQYNKGLIFSTGSIDKFYSGNVQDPLNLFLDEVFRKPIGPDKELIVEQEIIPNDDIKNTQNSIDILTPAPLPPPLDFPKLTLNQLQAFLENPTATLLERLLKFRGYSIIRKAYASASVANIEYIKTSTEMLDKKLENVTFTGVVFARAGGETISKERQNNIPENAYSNTSYPEQSLPEKSNNYRSSLISAAIMSGDETLEKTSVIMTDKSEGIIDNIKHDIFKLNSSIIYLPNTDQFSPAFSISVNFKDVVRNPKELLVTYKNLGINDNTTNYVKDYFVKADNLLKNNSVLTIGLSALGKNSNKSNKEIEKDIKTEIEGEINSEYAKVEEIIENGDTLLKKRITYLVDTFTSKALNTIAEYNIAIKKITDKLDSLNSQAELSAKVKELFNETSMPDEVKELLCLLIIDMTSESASESLEKYTDLLEKLLAQKERTIYSAASKLEQFKVLTDDAITYLDDTIVAKMTLHIKDRVEYLKNYLYSDYFKVLNEDLKSLLQSYVQFKQVQYFVEKKLDQYKFLNYFSVTAVRPIDPSNGSAFGLGLTMNPSILWTSKNQFYRPFPITLSIGRYNPTGQRGEWDWFWSVNLNTFLSNLVQNQFSFFNPNTKASK